MEAYMTAPRLDVTQTTGRRRMVEDEVPIKRSFDDSFNHPLDHPLLANGSSTNCQSIGQSSIVRSSVNLPWRASTYYGAATGNPSLSNALSMPEPQFKGHALGRLDPIKVPPIFPAARNNLFTRYTPDHWEASNSSNVIIGENVRNGSSKLRLEAVNLCREMNDKTKRTQEDVGKDLGERIGRVEHLKEAVKTELDEIINETESLQDVLAVLDRKCINLTQPLIIAQECLYSREKRRGVDLVHDNVEKELIEEIDVLKKCQNESKHLADQAHAQIALNRAAQHELEKDLNDKLVALNLDNRCHVMKNTSRDVKYHDGVHRIDNTASIPSTWVQFSLDNIRRSRSERKNSRDLRQALIVLNHEGLESEVEEARNRVDDALNDRLKEYQDAKNSVQQNLLKTLTEISEMEKVIELLKHSILEKESPLQVAQSRLVSRIRRPNVEACKDRPQYRLTEEVHEINESVDHLRSKLRQSEAALQQLLMVKLSLEHDLDIKNNSIVIDREQCLGIRMAPPARYVGTLLRSC